MRGKLCTVYTREIKKEKEKKKDTHTEYIEDKNLSVQQESELKLSKMAIEGTQRKIYSKRKEKELEE